MRDLPVLRETPRRRRGLHVMLTVRDVASWVDGQVDGDPTCVIRAAKPLSDSPGAEDITVVLDEKFLSQFHASNAAAGVVDHTVPLNGKTLVRVKDPLMAFVTIFQRMHGRPSVGWSGIHPSAVIHPTASIGPDTQIGPHVSIGANSVVGARCQLQAGVSIGHHCRVGDDVWLGPQVVIYDDCTVGNRVIIHGSAVIGADGFGFRTRKGRHVKVPQIGNVEIGDDVEIGAGTAVDRATFGTTRIGAGTKIDNLVQIAHNCQIGRHNLIAAQVGIAGSVTTGDYVVMAGQCGIVDHATIGDRTQLGARTAVLKDVAADQKMLGMPAIRASDMLRIYSLVERLPEMRKDLRAIKKLLGLEES